MASVRRHPNARTRWQVRYYDPDGSQRTKNFSRRVEADRSAARIETDKARGEWIDPKLAQTDFETWADHWLTTRVNLKTKTRIGYESPHVLARRVRSRVSLVAHDYQPSEPPGADRVLYRGVDSVPPRTTWMPG